jgi:2-iminobutanoate/2-iminopropanoate deaminase
MLLERKVSVCVNRYSLIENREPIVREILTSPNLPAPKFRYSPMVKSGPFYQTAGMIALDPATGTLASGGVAGETRQILANLRRAMPDFGLTLEHMIAATIYTTDFTRFPDINRAWEEVFTGDVAPPARTAVGVSALPLNASVEMEFRFYKEV